MSWFSDVLTSEFVWGIIVGIALSVGSVIFGLKLNNLRMQKIYLRFVRDLKINISENIDEMRRLQSDNKFINAENITAIDNELQIYGRNREHIVAIDSDKLKKEIRDYFNRVSIISARARAGLQDFYNNTLDTQTKFNRLHEANEACRELKELSDGAGTKLDSSIASALSGFALKYVV